jgi:hypothetical protein
MDDPRIVTGPPVRGSDLFGRAPVLQSLWKAIQRGSVLLTGPRRHGKTSVMYGLHDKPLERWQVVITDIEYLDDPADVLETMLASLLVNKPIRQFLKKAAKIPTALAKWAAGVLESIELETEPLGQVRISLRNNRPAETWQELAEVTLQALNSLPPEDHYLIILDEFPMFLEALFRKSADTATKFLQWFRAARQSVDSARFLIGGSVNLESILTRRGLSSLINDLEIVRLRPFTPLTAEEFTRLLLSSELGYSPEQVEQSAQTICNLVGEGVPFYLQMLASHLVDAIRIEGHPLGPETVVFVYNERVLGPDCKTRFDHYRSRISAHYLGDDADCAKIILCQLSDREWHTDESLVTAVTAAGVPSGAERIESVLSQLEVDYYIQRRDGKSAFIHLILADWWRFNIRPPARRS